MATKIQPEVSGLEIFDDFGGSIRLRRPSREGLPRGGVAIEVFDTHSLAIAVMDPEDVLLLRDKLNEFLGETNA